MNVMKTRKTNIKINVQYGKHGFDVYLNVSGTRHYLASHRPNSTLYFWLKSGKTLGELIRVKPGNSPAGQIIFHYTRHLLKLSESYIKYELAA